MGCSRLTFIFSSNFLRSCLAIYVNELKDLMITGLSMDIWAPGFTYPPFLVHMNPEFRFVRVKVEFIWVFTPRSLVCSSDVSHERAATVFRMTEFGSGETSTWTQIHLPRRWTQYVSPKHHHLSNIAVKCWKLLFSRVCNRFFSQSFPLLPTHSRCRGCLFSLDHTQTHTTVGRTALDEGSARRRDLYLKTQTLYKRQTSMPPVWFEPTIPAGARPQTYAVDRAATGVGQSS
jgi:hypothetical protein